MYPGKMLQGTECSTCPTSTAVMDSDTFQTDLTDSDTVVQAGSRVGHDPIREVLSAESCVKRRFWALHQEPDCNG